MTDGWIKDDKIIMATYDTCTKKRRKIRDELFIIALINSHFRNI